MRPLRVIAPVLLALLAVLGGALPAHADFGTDYADPITADPPVARPHTPACTSEVMHERQFRNGYGSPPDTPYVSTVAPSCRGPWQKIVLDLDGSVAGRQFDRIFSAYVGGVQVLLSSTPEPSQDGISWHVEKDLTRYAPLFTGQQPFVFDLANVVDDTYTGVFTISAKITFYTGPAPVQADKILTVSNGAATANSQLSLTRDARTAGADVTFPRNLAKLTAEVYTRGGGTCEEFWYGGAPDEFVQQHPGVCGAGPFRELTLSIDGRPAGAVWPYPVIYTGGFNPLLWRPSPAIFAFDLPAYTLDLTPYAGLLVDGKPHRIALTLNAADAQANDGWVAQANLFATVDRGVRQTRGGLTAYNVAANASVRTQQSDKGGGNGTFHVTATRHDRAAGWIQGSHGIVRSTTRDDLGYDAKQTLDQGGNHDVIVNRSTQVRTAGGRTTVETAPLDVDYTFAAAPGDGFDLLTSYEQAYTKVEPGQVTDHRMTANAHYVTGSAPLRTGRQTETYTSVGRTGCYRHDLAAVDGWYTLDRITCGTA